MILDLASLYCPTIPDPVLVLPAAKISDSGKWGLVSNKKQLNEMVLISAMVRTNYCINAAICGSLASITTHLWNSRNGWWLHSFIPVLLSQFFRKTDYKEWKPLCLSYGRDIPCDMEAVIVPEVVELQILLLLKLLLFIQVSPSHFCLYIKIQFWEWVVSKDFLTVHSLNLPWKSEELEDT